MRLTEKVGNIYRLKEYSIPAGTSVFMVEKLGKIEDILEKYGIDDLDVLDQILEVQKFLVEHEYATLPREELDLLFKKVGELK